MQLSTYDLVATNMQICSWQNLPPTLVGGDRHSIKLPTDYRPVSQALKAQPTAFQVTDRQHSLSRGNLNLPPH